MEMEAVNREIIAHIEAAYKLLPDVLEIHFPCDTREQFEQRYQNKNWCQIYYSLRRYSETNTFSYVLLGHLDKIAELYVLYDRLGMRRVLEQLTDEEKCIIGECLHATAFGPFFLNDSEFPSSLGLSTMKLRGSLKHGPMYAKLIMRSQGSLTIR